MNLNPFFFNSDSWSRMERAQSETLFLAGIVEKSHSYTIDVIGSTGNVYQVEVKNNQYSPWVCSCPDASINHNICKHMFFLYFLFEEEHDYNIFYETISKFRSNHSIVLSLPNNDISKETLQKLYQEYLKQILDEKPKQEFFFKLYDLESKMNINKDATCCICLDDMNFKTDSIVVCGQCSHGIHQNCLQSFFHIGKQQCPFCRLRKQDVVSTGYKNIYFNT